LGESFLSAGIAQGLGSVGAVAGDITLNATGEIKIIGQGSGVFNVVQSQAQGNGGNLTINAQQLLVQDGAGVATTTGSAGKGGNLTVNATEKVEISGFRTLTNGEVLRSSLLTGATANATGDAGDLRIDTKELIVRDGATVFTTTAGASKGGNLTVNATEFIVRDGAFVSTFTGAGKGGNLTVNATEKVEISGFRTLTNGEVLRSSLLTSTVATGDAGDLKIDTKKFIVRDGAFVSTSTVGAGKGGNLSVNATEKVEISGFLTSANGQASPSSLTSAPLSLTAETTGNAGDLKIDTKEFIVRDGAEVSTRTEGAGKGGNLTVNATDKVEISGFRTSADGQPSSSSLLTGASATGNAGDLIIDTKEFIVRDGARVDTTTSGAGKAGNLTVNAREKVEVSGFLTLANGEVSRALATGTTATGDAGDLKIDTKEFIVRDGARVDTTTYGAGKGGNLTVNATEKVEISGGTSANGQASSTGLRTSTIATGDAGSLKIDTQQLIVRDGAKVSVENLLGTGAAGNLEINARSIRLDNEGELNARSTSNNGGNINLQVADLLLLRRRSQISASGGTAQQGGDGGNITINAPNGFIVGVRNENSDITANAFNGTGGKININSLGIFNFTQRSREDLVRQLGTDNPNQLNTRDLQTNDITAFSLTNQNLSGEVTINTPDADQSLGLVELPIVLPDTSKFIANTGCDAIASTDADTDKSKFTITGRGGLPPSPYEPLSTDVIWLDTRTSAITSQQQRSEGSAAKPPSKADAVEIVPATGWVFDGKGNVTLISNASKANSLGTTPAGCPKK
jgi:large exoprotein involved in heme utilization and adhesion